MSQSLYAGAPTRSAMQTSAGASDLMERVLQQTVASGFDADAWHVMQQRDNALIEQEIINGAGSSKFIYNFSIAGTNVSGISAVGARELRAHYGGIETAMLSSWRKEGALFVFTTYPHNGSHSSIETRRIPELADEPDGYNCLMQVRDIKTGNVTVAEKFEKRYESKRDGSSYERPHFATIAQAKAERNGILAIIPQAVQLKWKEEMLKHGKTDTITSSVLAEKRGNVLRFAAAKAIQIDRRMVETLTLDQIAGLGDAAREGATDQFRAAAAALGIMATGGLQVQVPAQQEAPAETKAPAPKADSKLAETLRDVAKEAVEKKAAVDLAAQQQAAPAAQTSAPSFVAYLLDEDGNMLSTVRDPVIYARDLLAQIAKTDEQWHEAIIEQNAEYIAAAREASLEAADLLAKVDGDPGDKGELTLPSAVVAIPVNDKGAPQLKSYLEALRTSLNAHGTGAENLMHWLDANAETIGKVSAATRRMIDKMIADHKTVLGMGKPPAPAAEPHEQAGPQVQQEAAREEALPEDPDARRADEMVQQIVDCKNRDDLNVMRFSAAFQAVYNRFGREREDLHQRIRTAGINREAQLKAPQG